MIDPRVYHHNEILDPNLVVCVRPLVVVVQIEHLDASPLTPAT